MNWFVGYGIEAPWPENVPSGQIVPPLSRHLTTLFFGKEKPQREVLTKPPFVLSPGGVIDGLLFLSKVVAYSPSFFEPGITSVKLPHITVSRTTGQEELWEKQFYPIPFYLKDLNLYHTVGHLQYEKVETYPFIPPFEEIEHTADIAFMVRGRHVGELYRNGALALAFRVPTLSKWIFAELPKSLEEVVTALNRLLYLLDVEEGSPLKAVSHAGFVEPKGDFLEWEMIVDV